MAITRSSKEPGPYDNRPRMPATVGKVLLEGGVDGGRELGGWWVIEAN